MDFAPSEEQLAAVEAWRRFIARDLAPRLGAFADRAIAKAEAHALLRQLDVSSPDLDRLADAALIAGALGAKLTGGGRGGCLIALATDADSARDLAASLMRAGAAAAWTTNLEPAP